VNRLIIAGLIILAVGVGFATGEHTGEQAASYTWTARWLAEEQALTFKRDIQKGEILPTYDTWAKALQTGTQMDGFDHNYWMRSRFLRSTSDDSSAIVQVEIYTKNPDTLEKPVPPIAAATMD